MPPREIGKLWVMIMDEYQAIENIEGFYDYVTNTWRDDDAFCWILYYGFIMISKVYGLIAMSKDGIID